MPLIQSPNGAIKVFNKISNLPYLHCGCCGNKMLTRNALSDIMTDVFQLSSSKAAEKLEDKNLSAQSGFYFLKLLINEYPNKSFSSILNMDNVKKAIAQLDDSSQELIKSLAEKAEKYALKAGPATGRLKKYSAYMREYNKTILDKFDEYAKKYPDEDYKGILQKKEVYSIHFDSLKAKEKAIFSKLKNETHNANDADRQFLSELNDFAEDIYKDDELYYPLKKSALMDKFSENKDRITDASLRKQIYNILKSLPSVNTDIDAFFVKNAQAKTSTSDIIKTMLKEAVSVNEEFYKDGQRQTSLIRFCTSCDRNRGTAALEDFVAKKPETIVNTRKQVNEILDNINNGTLQHNELYLNNVQQELFDRSCGSLYVDIAESFPFDAQTNAKFVNELNRLAEIGIFKGFASYPKGTMQKMKEMPLKELSKEIMKLNFELEKNSSKAVSTL